MISLLLVVVGCVIGLVILAALGVGIFIVLRAGQRDTVSNAREGWIQRRSEKDEQGW